MKGSSLKLEKPLQIAFNIGVPARRGRAAASHRAITARRRALPVLRSGSGQPNRYGKMANTRAGNPEPAFGFGKLTTTIAPDSGT